MREITILEKIYRNHRDAKRSLMKILDDLLEIDARVTSVSTTTRQWAKITLEGPDEEAAEKYLESQYGRTCTLREIGEGDIRRGKITDLGRIGYGVYVDIGVLDGEGRPIDALLPSFALRKQMGVKGSISVRRLSKSLGLTDYLPLDIRILKIDREKEEIEARLTNAQARHLGRGRHRFYVCGETRRKIKNALQRTGNSPKIVRIRRLGLLESEVQCSKEVDPLELVRQIGPLINAQITVPRGL
ncbi:MAG: DUF2110 family protein [Deltaproteobacteria bacterium]|nr:DUF2110 family protein [Deltaproteobacteria bacterium]